MYFELKSLVHQNIHKSYIIQTNAKSKSLKNCFCCNLWQSLKYKVMTKYRVYENIQPVRKTVYIALGKKYVLCRDNIEIIYFFTYEKTQSVTVTFMCLFKLV